MCIKHLNGYKTYSPQKCGLSHFPLWKCPNLARSSFSKKSLAPCVTVYHHHFVSINTNINKTFICSGGTSWGEAEVCLFSCCPCVCHQCRQAAGTVGCGPRFLQHWVTWADYYLTQTHTHTHIHISPSPSLRPIILSLSLPAHLPSFAQSLSLSLMHTHPHITNTHTLRQRQCRCRANKR